MLFQLNRAKWTHFFKQNSSTETVFGSLNAIFLLLHCLCLDLTFREYSDRYIFTRPWPLGPGRVRVLMCLNTCLFTCPHIVSPDLPVPVIHAITSKPW